MFHLYQSTKHCWIQSPKDYIPLTAPHSSLIDRVLLMVGADCGMGTDLWCMKNTEPLFRSRHTNSPRVLKICQPKSLYGFLEFRMGPGRRRRSGTVSEFFVTMRAGLDLAHRMRWIQHLRLHHIEWPRTYKSFIFLRTNCIGLQHVF